MAHFQSLHWWFMARQDILCRIIKNLQLPQVASILEIGCGTGGNLKMLQQFGQVYAMESDPGAIEHAQRISNIAIKQGCLPDHIPYHGGSFDLICLFDVLEHVEKDLESLMKIAPLLTSSGKIILTVPAHMFLFGPHDRALHHFRRYSKKRIQEIMTQSGLVVNKISYFNSMLFPVILLTRCMDVFLKNKNTIGYQLPHPFLNQLLYQIFALEKNIICDHDLPMGVSVMVIAGPSS